MQITKPREKSKIGFVVRFGNSINLHIIDLKTLTQRYELNALNESPISFKLLFDLTTNHSNRLVCRPRNREVWYFNLYGNSYFVLFPISCQTLRLTSPLVRWRSFNLGIFPNSFLTHTRWLEGEVSLFDTHNRSQSYFILLSLMKELRDLNGRNSWSTMLFHTSLVFILWDVIISKYKEGNFIWSYFACPFYDMKISQLSEVDNAYSSEFGLTHVNYNNRSLCSKILFPII